MCMIEDADGACQVLQDQTRTARKEHRCSECSRIIRAGEDYQYEFTLYDGSCNTHKTCSHCQVSRAWLSENCGGWVYGAVEEDIADHARDYRRKDLIRLKWGMGRRWTKRNGDLMPLPALPASLDSGDAQKLMH